MHGYTVNIAYDALCDGTHIRDSKNGCHYNEYENIFTHTNGDAHSRVFEFLDGKKFKNVITRYDYHIPLETVLTKNKFKINRKKLSQALQDNEKFIYTINPRYFIKLLIDDKTKNFLRDILTKEHVQNINNNKCLFIIADIFESAFYTDTHLTLLKQFCEEITLDYRKVNILTSNPYNIREYTYDFKIMHWPYWECVVQYARDYFIKHKYTFFKTKIEEYKKYRFLLLNGKRRQHRYYLCYELWKKNNFTFDNICISLDEIDYDKLISLSPYLIRENITESYQYFNPLEYNEETEKNIKQFLKILPLFTEFDKDILSKIQNTFEELPEQRIRNKHTNHNFFKFSHWDTFNKDMYQHCDIHVVTETLAEFKNTSDIAHLFITEKTYKPIAFKAPFIIVGQQGILKYLREQGYRTFSELWDESYDEEEDPGVRMSKIIEVINQILKLPDIDYNNLIERTKEIVNYNFQVLKSRLPEQPYIDMIFNFLKTT